LIAPLALDYDSSRIAAVRATTTGARRAPFRNPSVAGKNFGHIRRGTAMRGWNWGLGIAIAAGAYVFNSAMQADRDSTGAIVAEGSVDAFQMRVGDCFDDGAAFANENPEVQSVPGVPCSQPHDNEVYAVFDVSVASFPGDAMADMANEGCRERFESFVGRDYHSSSLDIATLYPSHDSWHRQHDREVVCAVYDVDAKKLTGSVKGLAL
jgi:hypothetical protein